MAAPLLSLDLATATGWAVLKVNGKIFHGTENFSLAEGERSGQRFRRFKLFLQEIKDASGGDLDGVYFEQSAGSFRNILTAPIYFGLVGVLTEWCEMYGIPYASINPKTLKKYITGSGKAEKSEIMNRLKRNGFNPENHNEADALAVLAWALDKHHDMKILSDCGSRA